MVTLPMAFLGVSRKVRASIAERRARRERIGADEKYDRRKTWSRDWPFQDWLKAHNKSLLIYLTIAIAGFVIADLAVMMLRGRLLPDLYQQRPPVFQRRSANRSKDRSFYSTILNRNIFNADGVIPEPFGQKPQLDLTQAVRSQLPLDLIATIVHIDSAASIAILKMRSEPAPQVLQKGERVGGFAEIVEIKRGRVYLHDGARDRLEYVEIPLDQPLPIGEFGAVAPGVVRESENEYAVEQSTLVEQTDNLATLLQQARAVPRLNSSGTMDGFKIEHIQPGSMFEKLGLKAGDVILGVNGQKLETPSKAIELYNALRGEKSFQVDIERGGRTETLSYSVR